MDSFELREEYTSEIFDEKNVHKSPFEQFKNWFDEATKAKIFEPNAMALASVDLNGAPSVRMILMKTFDEKGITFFSNYESKKGQQFIKNPNVAVLFYWEELERQVRIEGKVEKLSPEGSDKYFETRPVGSRLGAWASPQSTIIADRNWLESKHNEFRQQYKHGTVPRPANCGGYILKPHSFEFWQGRQNRLHDRIEYILEKNKWNIRRLAP